jgi:hypothetical protein
LQSCEYVLYSVSVILEHVNEVVGVFVLSATTFLREKFAEVKEVFEAPTDDLL